MAGLLGFEPRLTVFETGVLAINTIDPRLYFYSEFESIISFFAVFEIVSVPTVAHVSLWVIYCYRCCLNRLF